VKASEDIYDIFLIFYNKLFNYENTNKNAEIEKIVGKYKDIFLKPLRINNLDGNDDFNHIN